MIEAVTRKEVESGKINGMPIYPKVNFSHRTSDEGNSTIDVQTMIKFSYETDEYYVLMRATHKIYEEDYFSIKEIRELLEYFEQTVKEAQEDPLPVPDDKALFITFYKLID